MEHITIKATKRTVGNKQSIKTLRRNGLVPCVIYGQGTENELFAVDAKELKSITHTPTPYIVDMDIEGNVRECIIKDMQFHPVTDATLHMDFLAVSDKKPIVMEVPVKVVGTAAGVKIGGKLADKVRKIKVCAMMDKLPSLIELNVEPLKLGESLTAGDINLDGVQVVAPKSFILCTVMATRQTASAAAE